MKTDHVLITVPAEGPEIPEGWMFVGYEVVDEDFREEWPEYTWRDGKNLKEAGQFYAGRGEDMHQIIALCEHCTEDGCYEIYSVWGRNHGWNQTGNSYEWSPWFDRSDSAYTPFDFERWKKEIA